MRAREEMDEDGGIAGGLFNRHFGNVAAEDLASGQPINT
jgi:hypothetical protein